MTEPESWTDGATRSAITDFVARVSDRGRRRSSSPPSGSRSSTTTAPCGARSRCRSSSTSRSGGSPGMAAADPTLRDRQPYKAAYERDQLDGRRDGEALPRRRRRPPAAHGRRSRRPSTRWTSRPTTAGAGLLAEATHPTLGRAYRECGFAPMVELLLYLEANGFTTYIASGGDRDFMRPVASDLYGIPPERVIGSARGARVPRTTTATSLYKAGHGLLRRRPGEAGAHLEPHRPTARSSPPATPTATCRCWRSPAGRSRRRFACCCCTTTPSASHHSRAGASAGALTRTRRRRRSPSRRLMLTTVQPSAAAHSSAVSAPAV